MGKVIGETLSRRLCNVDSQVIYHKRTPESSGDLSGVERLQVDVSEYHLRSDAYREGDPITTLVTRIGRALKEGRANQEDLIRMLGIQLDTIEWYRRENRHHGDCDD